ncbi:hypothetical protein ABFG93_09495 [Pseudalkalibacillus hwajinpoensis]|uniref:hypothetical protein n=1 Tax=Guptibacillus hwajinpoensis TaxID=208199 RepID=UPI00325A4535
MIEVIPEAAEVNKGMNEIPLILTDSENSIPNRIKGYRFGADDFLDQDVSIEEYLLRVNRKISKRKMIVHSVLTDELTGAYNRKFLDSQLNYMRYDLVRNGEKATLEWPLLSP